MTEEHYRTFAISGKIHGAEYNVVVQIDSFGLSALQAEGLKNVLMDRAESQLEDMRKVVEQCCRPAVVKS